MKKFVVIALCASVALATPDLNALPELGENECAGVVCCALGGAVPLSLTMWSGHYTVVLFPLALASSVVFCLLGVENLFGPGSRIHEARQARLAVEYQRLEEENPSDI